MSFMQSFSLSCLRNSGYLGSAFFGIPLPPKCSASTCALASVTSSMADEDAPPSKLATFFRTLLCASGSVKSSRDEGSDCPVFKATKPKEVSGSVKCSKNEGSDCPVVKAIKPMEAWCPNSPSPASGIRQVECFVSSPRPLVNSGLGHTEPSDILLTFSFGDTGILEDEPSFIAKIMHAEQEGRMHSRGGWLRTPPGELRLRPVPNGNDMFLPYRSSSRVRCSLDSLGYAAVEARQAFSNRFARQPVSAECGGSRMGSASASPVSRSPAWLRTSSLAPRLQDTRVGRLLDGTCMSAEHSVVPSSRSVKVLNTRVQDLRPYMSADNSVVRSSHSVQVMNTVYQDLLESCSEYLEAKTSPASTSILGAARLLKKQTHEIEGEGQVLHRRIGSCDT
eukprot:gene28327-31447_t